MSFLDDYDRHFDKTVPGSSPLTVTPTKKAGSTLINTGLIIATVTRIRFLLPARQKQEGTTV